MDPEVDRRLARVVDDFIGQEHAGEGSQIHMSLFNSFHRRALDAVHILGGEGLPPQVEGNRADESLSHGRY